MTAIGVYFDDPEKMGYPFNYRDYFFQSYGDFSALLKRKGLETYIVRGSSYLGNMYFKAGWKYSRDGKKIIDINHQIKTDLVLIRGEIYKSRLNDTDLTINTVVFEKRYQNKWNCYQDFSNNMALTYNINQSNFKEVLSKIKSEYSLLKPHYGMGGRGIVIKKTQDVKSNDIPNNKPYILQEYLDSSAGIPGIIKGKHDLRLINFNGVYKLGFIRLVDSDELIFKPEPKAVRKFITIKKLPKDVFNLAKTVDQKLSKYNPRFYSLDIMFHNGKPYIIEINTTPGMPAPNQEKYSNYYSRFHYYLYLIIKNRLN